MRYLIGLVASVIVVVIAVVAPTSESSPNGSSDGRYHTCGYVTEDGVTEYLDVYAERCGYTPRSEP